MKSKLHIWLLVLLFVTSAIVVAKPNKDKPSDPPVKKKKVNLPDTLDEIAQVPQKSLLTMEKLLKMSQRELARMRSTLRKIEHMPQEEKNDLLNKIKKFRTMQRQKQKYIENAVRNMLPEQRAAMIDYYDNLSPTKSQEMRRRVNKMSPKEREHWRREIFRNAAKKKKLESASNEDIGKG